MLGPRAVLTADVVASANGGPAFSGTFESRFSDPALGSVRIATPVATQEDGSGGAAFGEGAQYFALANNRDIGDPEPDSGVFFSPTNDVALFGTNAVASRTGGDGIGLDDDRIFTGGYAATTGFSTDGSGAYVGRSAGPAGAAGVVTPGANNVVLALQLDDFFSVGGAPDDEPAIDDLVVFFGGPNGRGAAIDDEAFAARAAAPGVAEVNGVEIPNFGGGVGEQGFHGALASAAIAGDGGIFPAGVRPSSQALSWGWWAGDVRAADFGDAAAALDADQRLNLGSWIAGDVTASANLPLNGSATYSGFATISVVDGGATFVDGAGVTLDYDFGDDVGTMRFNDLLGQNPTIAVTDNVFDAQFGGTAGIDLNGRDGLIDVRGSFFNGAGGGAAEAAAGAIAVQSLDNTIAGSGVFGVDIVPR
ncbi:MAG: hypothetical protein AAGF90_21085 [Pseudomonadota bacterium]